MIKKILQLGDIGCFSSFSQEKDFQYGDKNCNIIFGFNGSGKTTISNVLSFFADNSFIDEDEKKEIFDDIKNNNDPIIKLKLDDENIIEYSNLSRPHNKKIYIFNAHFVATHVFDGTKARLKRFKNVSGEIKNKEIDRINDEIMKVEKDKTGLEKENAKFEEKFGEIKNRINKNLKKTLTHSRLTVPKISEAVLPNQSIDDLQGELEKLIEDYNLSKKQKDLKPDLEILNQIDFSKKIDINLTLIKNLLSKDVKQLSKEVLERRIKNVQNLFKNESFKQSAERWFKYGKDVLKNIDQKTEKICPLCNTNITEKFKNLLTEYDGYFDERYDKFITSLNNQIEAVGRIITFIKKLELDVGKLENIFSKYNKLLKGLLFDKYDFTQIKIDLEQLKLNLKIKNDNIQQSFSVPVTLSENIKTINISIAKFDTLKSVILKLLESKTLKTNDIETKIREVHKNIIIMEFDQSHKNGALFTYKTNNNNISKLEKTKIPQLKNNLLNELKKIKAESKGILEYLVKMGITHFDIDINQNQAGENIIIKYNNLANNKNKLENSLSDGEKTALAFAYFLSKFENEVNTLAKVKKSVIVIDDPISSLDQNRLYSTAHLIYKKFEDARQLIVLSHNFLFLKYFNSLSNHPLCFFLDQNKISELPEELRNFETPYFYMLRNLLDFNNGRMDYNYNEVKKYLPNYIRRILETFLSFKFSRIVNKPGGYRSPGLKDFDESIKQTDLDDTIKKDLREKITKIKSICDAHSHGNAHYTEENFYISEDDLKIIAKNTVDIIETMDRLHQTSFIVMNKKQKEDDCACPNCEENRPIYRAQCHNCGREDKKNKNKG